MSPSEGIKLYNYAELSHLKYIVIKLHIPGSLRNCHTFLSLSYLIVPTQLLYSLLIKRLEKTLHAHTSTWLVVLINVDHGPNMDTSNRTIIYKLSMHAHLPSTTFYIFLSSYFRDKFFYSHFVLDAFLS